MCISNFYPSRSLKEIYRSDLFNGVINKKVNNKCIEINLIFILNFASN